MIHILKLISAVSRINGHSKQSAVIWCSETHTWVFVGSEWNLLNIVPLDMQYRLIWLQIRSVSWSNNRVHKNSTLITNEWHWPHQNVVLVKYVILFFSINNVIACSFNNSKYHIPLEQSLTEISMHYLTFHLAPDSPKHSTLDRQVTIDTAKCIKI